MTENSVKNSANRLLFPDIGMGFFALVFASLRASNQCNELSISCSCFEAMCSSGFLVHQNMFPTTLHFEEPQLLILLSYQVRKGSGRIFDVERKGEGGDSNVLSSKVSSFFLISRRLST